MHRIAILRKHNPSFASASIKHHLYETEMIDRYGVMGHPIGHTKSPFIHTRFAKQTGQSTEYSAMHVLPGEFAQAIAAFQAKGGKGLSITLPFKEEAKDLVEVLTSRARRANSVNTIRFDESGEKYGDNTDGIGLIRDLQINHRISMAGQRILLLGAGGAARGVIGPLLDERPKKLIIANRTPEKARTLAAQFLSERFLPEKALSELSQKDIQKVSIKGCGLDEIGSESFDLIVNATSASLEGRIPPLPDTVLRAGGSCYDLMYDVNRPTAFVSWGKQHGASRSVDGLGMLVEQAAESFYYWRKVRPDTKPVIAALRNAQSLMRNHDYPSARYGRIISRSKIINVAR
uniref:Shikimate dehydrogenase (NADP(+)) n=1 Tax=Candidatus Kentrum eta TaxID=2126337 RepID=A0A450U946_9GAMM|nr:MAG: shikimate dehydrogenase [Candidatus Kentron sp. H]VFJ90495.1 MAG: shikimate dehydrogenase [Candidatus Kentron sp. H]VFJ96668.1 MAG: shikimate dehydrogenase [Candidatus Kentron sp. H]